MPGTPGTGACARARDRQRAQPPRITSGQHDGGVANESCVSPASTDCTRRSAALVGTWTISTPARRWNSTAARCGAAPFPNVAKLSLPGFFFAWSIKLPQRAHADRRVHCHHQRRRAHLADRRQVAQRLEAGIRVEAAGSPGCWTGSRSGPCSRRARPSPRSPRRCWSRRPACSPPRPARRAPSTRARPQTRATKSAAPPGAKPDHQLDGREGYDCANAWLRKRKMRKKVFHDSAESKADNKAPVSAGSTRGRPSPLPRAAPKRPPGRWRRPACGERRRAAPRRARAARPPRTGFSPAPRWLNTAASISPRSSAPISSASGRVSAGSDQR